MNQNKSSIPPIDTLILKHLQKTKKAADAETLWFDLRASGYLISYCSIYFNLKKLINMGILMKKPDGKRKYIYQTPEHFNNCQL